MVGRSIERLNNDRMREKRELDVTVTYTQLLIPGILRACFGLCASKSISAASIQSRNPR